MKLIGDYHTHTCYSHGKGTVHDNVKAAADRGLEEIAISDHGPALFWLGVTGDKAWHEMRRDIDRCQKEFPQVSIKQSVEANIISPTGELDMSHERQEELDMVLAGVHPLAFAGWLHKGAPMLLEHWRGKLNHKQHAKAKANFTKMVVEAVYRNDIDVITHPGHGVPIDTAELARACARRDTALEINNRIADRLDDFIKTAMKTGVKFCINSDAHRPDAVGELSAGLAVAQRAKLPSEQILNAREE